LLSAGTPLGRQQVLLTWLGQGLGLGLGGERGGQGEAPGSRSSPISHLPNFIFGNPGQPQSLKIPL